MSERYSHLYEGLDLRIEEAERVGYGFDLPGAVSSLVAPNAPKLAKVEQNKKAA